MKELKEPIFKRGKLTFTVIYWTIFLMMLFFASNPARDSINDTRELLRETKELQRQMYSQEDFDSDQETKE